MDNVLEAARDWAIAHHPKASNHKVCAFANSVQYLVTGYSGGYGGPSIREHLCSHALVGDGENISTPTNLGNLTVSYRDGRLPRAGKWSFDRACEFCKPICFGQLSRYALKVVQVEYCFDDDPDDLVLIKEWELEELAELSAKKKRGKLPQREWLRLKYLNQKYDQ